MLLTSSSRRSSAAAKALSLALLAAVAVEPVESGCHLPTKHIEIFDDEANKNHPDCFHAASGEQYPCRLEHGTCAKGLNAGDRCDLIFNDYGERAMAWENKYHHDRCAGEACAPQAETSGAGRHGEGSSGLEGEGHLTLVLLLTPTLM